MDYFVGDVLWVDGETYCVSGKIRYKNLDDGENWTEYKLKSKNSRTEKWLSVDDKYEEYSISTTGGYVSMDGFHEVDHGTEYVIGAWGDVDVEPGDQARFIEYEDETEEKIVSIELWDDGEERSEGYYLDKDEYRLVSQVSNRRDGPSKSGEGGSNKVVGWIMGMMVVFWMLPGIIPVFMNDYTTTISKYLKKSASFTYETSITGKDSQKADVYKWNVKGTSFDAVAEKIIRGIGGNTESVQQNTEDEDDSVAILTKKEYCLVYTAENGDILVQVSSRKYAYTTDKEPYRARAGTSRYYRRFYRWRAYTVDSNTYRKSTSSYTDYSDASLGTNSADHFSTYSSSVRQASAEARSSSGGGTSSGK